MLELGAEGEAAWQALRQHAEWAEGVWFGWVFVASPKAVAEFVDRLDGLASAHLPSLVIPLDEPERAVERLFSDEARGRRAVWIVGQGLEVRPWETLHLLLNERRERIRRHLGAALLFVGRPDWKEAARTAAPDLWSQRTVVLEWASGVDAAPSDRVLRLERGPRAKGDRRLVVRGLRRARAKGDRAAEAVALTRLSEIELAEKAPRKAHETAAKAVDLAPPGLARARALDALAAAELALGDPSGAARHYRAAAEEPGGSVGDEGAWRAIEEGLALLEVGRASLACDAFRRAVESAAGDGTQANALFYLGEAARTLHDLDQASEAYRRALDLLRPLGPGADTPDVIDRCLVMSGLAYALRRRGDLEAARALHEQSYELLGRLSESERALPEVLAAQVRAAGEFGDSLEAVGDLAGARDAYAESVQAARDLVSLIPGDLAPLRHLSISLAKLTDCLRQQGELQAAWDSAQECLQIRVGHRRRTGDTPGALHDHASALGLLGDVAQSLGRLDAALAAYGEAVELFRRVRQGYGDRPDALRLLVRVMACALGLDPNPSLLAEARALAAELVARWPSAEHEALARWLDSLSDANPVT